MKKYILSSILVLSSTLSMAAEMKLSSEASMKSVQLLMSSASEMTLTGDKSRGTTVESTLVSLKQFIAASVTMDSEMMQEARLKGFDVECKSEESSLAVCDLTMKAKEMGEETLTYRVRLDHNHMPVSMASLVVERALGD